MRLLSVARLTARVSLLPVFPWRDDSRPKVGLQSFHLTSNFSMG